MTDDLYPSAAELADSYKESQSMRDCLPFPSSVRDKWDALEPQFAENGSRAVSWTATLRVDGTKTKDLDNGSTIYELHCTDVGMESETRGRTTRFSLFVNPAEAYVTDGSGRKKINPESFDGRRLQLLGALAAGLGFPGPVKDTFNAVPGLAGKVFTCGYKVRQYKSADGSPKTTPEPSWVKVEG